MAADQEEHMSVRIPRRGFLAGMASMGAACAMSGVPGENGARAQKQGASPHNTMHRITSPFRVAVINDEITQDFARACHIAAREFGMEWIELRGMWNKNIVNLDSKEVAEAGRILQKYKLRVTDIASPLFKVDWPGAPKSRFSPKEPQFNADFSFSQQNELLERSLELAKAFKTDRVRCFDFWRLDDPAPYRKEIDAKLLGAA